MADARSKLTPDELRDTLKAAGEAFAGALDALLEAAKNPLIAKRFAATLSEHPDLLMHAFRGADFAEMKDDLVDAVVCKVTADELVPQYAISDIAEALIASDDEIDDTARIALLVWLGEPKDASDEVAWALAQLRSGDREEAEITLMKAFPDADWAARGRTRAPSPSLPGVLS